MKHSLKIPLKVNRVRTKSDPRYSKLSAGIAAGRVRFAVSPPSICAAESNVEREFAISNVIGQTLDGYFPVCNAVFVCLVGRRTVGVFQSGAERSVPSSQRYFFGLGNVSK
jgi:hypothetical protein